MAGRITSNGTKISIHALLAESDKNPLRQIIDRRISIHALLAESDMALDQYLNEQEAFLSTLSLRRATSLPLSLTSISIFLSTLSLRRATQSSAKSTPEEEISIHALLAESDNLAPKPNTKATEFLSTLSLRRATREPTAFRTPHHIFLSTLSLRRATNSLPLSLTSIVYFYPRSPCGERLETICCWRCNGYFYPRSPCGERRFFMSEEQKALDISIHALLAESD